MELHFTDTRLYGHPDKTLVGVPLVSVLTGLHCSSTLRFSFFLKHTRTTGRTPAHSIRIPATVKDHLYPLNVSAKNPTKLRAKHLCTLSSLSKHSAVWSETCQKHDDLLYVSAMTRRRTHCFLRGSSLARHLGEATTKATPTKPSPRNPLDYFRYSNSFNLCVQCDRTIL